MVKSVLFVCLGNICRSPIADAVFQHIIKTRDVEAQWKVDSAALIGYHTGKSPDTRARETLKKHNVLYNGKAREITKNDFLTFDYIFGMDESNIRELTKSKPSSSSAQIFLLGDFDPEGDRIIRDPYYDSGSEGFEKCYQQCVRSCNGFLDKLDKDGNLKA